MRRLQGPTRWKTPGLAKSGHARRIDALVSRHPAWLGAARQRASIAKNKTPPDGSRGRSQDRGSLVDQREATISAALVARARSFAEPAAALACWPALVTGQTDAWLPEHLVAQHSPANAVDDTKAARPRRTMMRFMEQMSGFGAENDGSHPTMQIPFPGLSRDILALPPILRERRRSGPGSRWRRSRVARPEARRPAPDDRPARPGETDSRRPAFPTAVVIGKTRRSKP